MEKRSGSRSMNSTSSSGSGKRPARRGSNHCIFLRVVVPTSNLRPLTLSSIVFGILSVRARFSVMAMAKRWGRKNRGGVFSSRTNCQTHAYKRMDGWVDRVVTVGRCACLGSGYARKEIFTFACTKLAYCRMVTTSLLCYSATARPVLSSVGSATRLTSSAGEDRTNAVEKYGLVGRHDSSQVCPTATAHAAS